MRRLVLLALLGLTALSLPGPAGAAARPASGQKVRVVVIPVRDEIAAPVLYIVRRGLKDAIARHADAVVLDMKTPGGALDVTFDIMEALAKFPGETITFVDDEAVSAGAFIAATTQEIWFAPAGVMGAAAPVTSTGGDVDATMKMKVVSYLKARIRAVSAGRRYRGDVLSAMIDSDYELKIDGKVLKEKGGLLSLTADEATKRYGDPPEPLLGAGIAKDVDDLLAKKFGPGSYETTSLEVTWSEKLAGLLHAVAPLLLGLGIFALYVEFKTPGFGIFGVAGLALLALVFLGNSAAGLSGHEPLLGFALGVILVALELFVFTGTVVLAVAGLALMLGSLVWSMADLWPNEPITLAWSGDAFVRPLVNLGLGLAVAAGLGVALARFLPRGWIWDKLVLSAAVHAAAQDAGATPGAGAALAALLGRTGIVVATLRPSGQVEIDGRRYEARSGFEALDVGTPVVVRGRTDFGLLVERTDG